jgi:RNA polymerase sigma-70 factor (ECF subfamily)
MLAGSQRRGACAQDATSRRTCRIARAIVRDDGEAEDVTQDAFVRAYEHLDQLAGRARFSTWLTRVAVHEASAGVRRRGRQTNIGVGSRPHHSRG